MNCNKSCAFCHSFYTKPKELPYVDNSVILSKLIKAGINRVTISGGEPLLYSNIYNIVKSLHCHGINVTIISNGFIPENIEVYRNVEEIVFSLDSVDPVINESIGRGAKHQYEVVEALRIARQLNPGVRIRINSVVSKINMSFLNDVGLFLRVHNISKWRLFKFAALREKSKLNKDRFQIPETDYLNIVKQLQKSFTVIEIQTRFTIDYETMYLLLLPNGNMVRTIKQDDQVIGNILDDDLTNIFKTLCC